MAGYAPHQYRHDGLSAGAWSGPKITARFKAKVFSFADITVSGDRLTFGQISEPLSGSSSATAANLYPFGTDLHGKRLNDPIPDTVFDPATRNVISEREIGTPALLDAFTVAKPDVEDSIETSLSASGPVPVGDNFEHTLKVIVTLGRLAPNDTVAVKVIKQGTPSCQSRNSLRNRPARRRRIERH